MTRRTDKSKSTSRILIALASALMLILLTGLCACTADRPSNEPSRVTTTTTSLKPISTTTDPQTDGEKDPVTDGSEVTDKDPETDPEPDVTEVTGEQETPDITTAEKTEAPKPEPEPDPAEIVMKRGDKSDNVRALQNRLIELNFLWDSADGSYGAKTENAVRIFQKYAGLEQTGKVSRALLELINGDSAPIAEITYDHEDVLDPDRKTDYYIIVYNDNNRVLVLGKDDFGKYNVVVKTFICSVGVKDEDHKGTPAGVFDIDKRYEWRTLFGHNGYKYVYGQYTTRFNGNYLFHSVPYIKSGEKDTLEMEEFEKLGNAASAGCVRLCVRDAKWIHDNAADGTLVRVMDGKNGPEEYEPIPALSYEDAYYGWDPTDPDENNPYNKKEEDSE